MQQCIRINYFFDFSTRPPFVFCAAGFFDVLPTFFLYFFRSTTSSSENSSSSSMSPYLCMSFSKKFDIDEPRSCCRIAICCSRLGISFFSFCSCLASRASRAYFLWRRMRFDAGSSLNALNSGTSPDFTQSERTTNYGIKHEQII